MKEMTRYGFILSLICIVAAGLLAGVNSLTKSRIIAQAQAQEEQSLKEVLPEGEIFKPIKINGEIIYYNAFDKREKLCGVAFKVYSKGYSSTIEAMVGLLKDGTITAIKILSQNETPGLGTQVAEEKFTGQFKNRVDLSTVQAITGATISSKAVINSVEKKAKEIKELIKNGQ
ncbi:MAG: FMN-binding protein [Candidatus Omnitrophota bacterium]